MANEKNLKPFTAAQSHEEAVRNGKKGGRASASAKKRKSGLLRAVQDIIDGKYIDEEGAEITGAQRVALNLYQIALNPNHRQCVQAIRTLFEIMDAFRTDDERQRDKLINLSKEKEIELIQKRIEKLDEGIWE